MLTEKSRESAKTKADGTRGRTKPKVKAIAQVPANPLWHQLATRVQAKLAVSAPDDPYEREADRVADQVMRMPEPVVQRACPACAADGTLYPKCQEEKKVSKGQYQPTTSAGAKLMAHELTHVIQQSGAWDFGAAQSTNERRLVPGTTPITGVIARQPAPPPPVDPGWSDAPEKGINKWVTTVDEKGKILKGKVESATSKGVWRVPVQGLRPGYQGKDKGPAFESPEGRAVALIPNTVKPAAPDKDKSVSVDVLLHFHGFGIGYRELKPREHDYAKVLEAGQVRDVELYQMEQRLLSHVEASKRLIIAVLPQGSERSDFGDLSSNSDADAYLKEVFDKLIPTYLPKGAIPGRVIVSGHSGGGVPAMAIANQRAKAGTEVILFDAINGPKELETVKTWVTQQMEKDVNSLSGLDEATASATLQTGGTRFRGYTSHKLTDKAGYGLRYNNLKTHIKSTIDKTVIKKFKVGDKVGDAVRVQLTKNYQVIEEQGLEKFKKNDFEPHERMMGEGTYLVDALKD